MKEFYRTPNCWIVSHKPSKGTYKHDALKNISVKKKSKYFIYKDNQYIICPQLKRIIQFQKHNLLEDVYPKKVD